MNYLTAIMDIKHFDSYTLTMNDIAISSGLFLVVLLVITLPCILVKLDMKRLSWIVSLFNSFVMTILGAVYLYVKLPGIQIKFSNYGFSIGESIFHEPLSNFTALMCLWFGIANAFDLALGFVFYRKYLAFLTAYVHHSVFIWTMVCCTTGNGGFIQTRTFASAFALATIEEIPTFLLALGSVLPSFRTDMGFGITFFIFRIAYHAILMLTSYYNYRQLESQVLILYTLTFMLHVNWFSAWISKYGFKKKEISKSK